MGVNPLLEPTYCLDMEMMTATKIQLEISNNVGPTWNKEDYNDDYEDRIKVQFLDNISVPLSLKNTIGDGGSTAL